MAFVGGKHHLADVRERFPAERHVHVGDTDVDRHYALLAGLKKHLASVDVAAARRKSKEKA